MAWHLAWPHGSRQSFQNVRPCPCLPNRLLTQSRPLSLPTRGMRFYVDQSGIVSDTAMKLANGASKMWPQKCGNSSRNLGACGYKKTVSRPSPTSPLVRGCPFNHWSNANPYLKSRKASAEFQQTIIEVHPLVTPVPPPSREQLLKKGPPPPVFDNKSLEC